MTLVNCQLVEEEGRARAMRAARSLAERTVTELILQHQNPQQLSANLWAAVRARGCQFLGPGRQNGSGFFPGDFQSMHLGPALPIKRYRIPLASYNDIVHTYLCKYVRTILHSFQVKAT